MIKLWLLFAALDGVRLAWKNCINANGLMRLNELELDSNSEVASHQIIATCNKTLMNCILEVAGNTFPSDLAGGLSDIHR